MWESAAPLTLGSKDRAALDALVRSPKTPQKVVFRALVILGAAEGTSNNQLAQKSIFSSKDEPEAGREAIRR